LAKKINQVTPNQQKIPKNLTEQKGNALEKQHFLKTIFNKL